MKENFLPFVLFFLVIKRCLCFCVYSFLVHDMDTSMLGVILKKKKCARKKQKKKNCLVHALLHTKTVKLVEHKVNGW